MTREEAIERLEDTFEGWERWNPHNDSPASKLSEALDMAISALREQPRWISVEEKLPDSEDVVLCVTKNKRPFVCRYDHYWKHWRVSGSVKVTHWMPMPEPPKEEV